MEKDTFGIFVFVIEPVECFFSSEKNPSGYTEIRKYLFFYDRVEVVVVRIVFNQSLVSRNPKIIE
jgi:hypothetical protein